MQYELKKDLPDCKAGAIFQWGLPFEGREINMDILYNVSDWCAHADFQKGKITNFDKWFKKIKIKRQ